MLDPKGYIDGEIVHWPDGFVTFMWTTHDHNICGGYLTTPSKQEAFVTLATEKERKV